MAGHNKWSKVKRLKAVTDGKKSKIWARYAREIMVAAREGGGNPDMNAKLYTFVQKAKSENMPKENIERAIKKGTGELAGADYEEISYEGYAPFGVAVFVECLTDNSVRTVADVRNCFNKVGGNVGTNGSVAYLFERKGVFSIPANGIDEMELFELVADAGADNLESEEDYFIVTCEVEQFGAVQQALDAAKIKVEEATLERFPLNTIKLQPEEEAKVQKMLDMLEDLQDVQQIFHCMETEE